MSKHISPEKFREELVNAITHGVGALLSVAGLVTLMVISFTGGDVWRMTSLTIYGASLTVLYLASTLYHSFHHPKTKHYLRIFDHSAIYVLIAGSYTPFALITLREHGGITLFFVMWGITLVGIVFKLFFVKRFNRLSTLLYIAMGWMALFVYEPFVNNMDANGLYLVVAGGLIYTLGAVFFLWEKLPYNHSIWHLFVMGGSLCHFLAIYYFVAPLG